MNNPSVAPSKSLKWKDKSEYIIYNFCKFFILLGDKAYISSLNISYANTLMTDVSIQQNPVYETNSS